MTTVNIPGDVALVAAEACELLADIDEGEHTDREALLAAAAAIRRRLKLG